MSLQRHEKIELVLEMIITIGIIFFLYLSFWLLFIEFLSLPMTYLGQPQTTVYEYFEWTNEKFENARFIFSIVMLIIGALTTVYRLRKRILAMRLNHVLKYVTYIAEGNYDIRIPEVNLGKVTDIIRSINHLVDSTVLAREEERKIEKTKDELIANVGHDLRTPLTSIIGYLGLIENKKYRSDEQLLDFTHIAYTKAISMQQLVNDLFDYAASRLTSYEIKVTNVPMTLFYNQLAADFEFSANEKGMAIEVDVNPQKLSVLIDPEKMARVFNNLISNAIKYGNGAKKIRLLAYEDKVANQKILEVRNDGELLAEEELEKIFRRSYRSDLSRNAEVPGTGLGLAIVKNIVELHHGKVYALIENNEMIFRIEMGQNK